MNVLRIKKKNVSKFALYDCSYHRRRRRCRRRCVLYTLNHPRRMSFRQFDAVGEFSFFFLTFTVYRIYYKYKMYNIMLYLRYVFIFVLRNNYTGRDYHPGPVHRSPLVVIIIVIIVVVVIGDQWSFVVVCDISTRSDIIGTPFSHHHPFHPQLEPGTRCVVRGRLLFLSRACATKYSAGPSRR